MAVVRAAVPLNCPKKERVWIWRREGAKLESELKESADRVSDLEPPYSAQVATIMLAALGHRTGLPVLSSSDDKPLPQVPGKQLGASTSRLTVESRAHLKEFIRYALAEEKVDGAYEWTKGIEIALNELMDSVSRGGWLAGFKRARRMDMLRRKDREKEQKRLEREQKEKEEDGKDGKKKQGRSAEEKAVVTASDRRGDDPPPRKESMKLNDERRRLALEQLHSALESPVPPSPKISPRHLLLTVSPKGAVLPSRDLDFDIIPSNKLCVFSADKYALPSMEEWDRGTGAVVLYGLDEWAAHMLERTTEDRPKLVGGTFSFTGLSSTAQLHSLTKVLRLSIFMLLSLLLEQSLLANSQVELHFPPQIEPQPLSFTLTSPPTTVRQPKSKSMRMTATSGIWSFFTKRTEGLLGRSSNSIHVASNPYSRTSSLDPHATSLSSVPGSPSNISRASRRVSFSLPRSPLRLGEAVKSKNEDDMTFSAILSRVSSASSLLSTSVGVVFSPPQVLNNLAEKERVDPGRKLLGDERVSLTSLIGWEGRENRGRGMTGPLGFARHQGITFLYAEYAPSKSALSDARKQTEKSEDTTDLNVPRSEKHDDETKNESNVKSSDSPTPFKNYTPTTLLPCDRGRIITYRYYAWSTSQIPGNRSGQCFQADRTLGDAIETFCAVEPDGAQKCEKEGCSASKSEHRKIWIHGGVRITAEICAKELERERSEDRENAPASSSGIGGPIFMWVSCAICKKETERKRMLDGTYLYSFAKYLELLIYSPSLCTITPKLCEHTSPESSSFAVNDTSPQSRFNIVRHFKCGPRSVKFTVSASPAVFELRMPRLQVVKGRTTVGDNNVNGNGLRMESVRKVSGRINSTGTIPEEKSVCGVDEDKRALRKEIKDWWQGVAEHLDRLDECFVDGELKSYHKSLPRLPTDIDPYDGDDFQIAADQSSLPPSSRSSSRASSRMSDSDDQKTIKAPTTPTSQGDSLSQGRELSTSSISSIPTHQLLLNLRHSFQQTEQMLYAQLSQTPTSHLNDVRHNFTTTSKNAKLRLSAWERKHIKNRKDPVTKRVGKLETPEPEWWKPGCHPVPGGSVVVREGEWGSIIAFTLSSDDYAQELSKMSSSKGDKQRSDDSHLTQTDSSASVKTAQTPHPSIATTSGTTSSRSSASALDPDIDTLWCEPEPYTTVIVRQDISRDPSGLMSLRDVLRHRRGTDNGQSSLLSPSKFSPSKFLSLKPSGNTAVASPRSVSLCTPPSAWADPAVEVSMQAAGGHVSGLPEAAESAERLLHAMESAAPDNGIGGSFFTGPWKRSSDVDVSNTGTDKSPVRRPPSIASVDSDIIAVSTDVNATVDKRGDETSDVTNSGSGSQKTDSSQMALASIIGSKQPPPPPLPPKESVENPRESTARQHEHTQSQSSTTNNSITSSLTSTVTSAMRYLLSPMDQTRPASPMHHHKLLAIDNVLIEERPHIKYEWTLGKRLRFTCIVYFARQFDLLRRRCGVEDVLPKSLERSKLWAAEGGKSKSNFWKTSDDRFVIKTLVDAWNVADLQVLLDIAPSYFRHMDGTASRPSVLAKLLGFYTVEIKNLETGTTQAKADLLVMENLFYNQNVTKTFDLKGIQGRRVKTSRGVAAAISGAGDGKDAEQKEGGEVKKKKRTLFDGDWIEDQRKALILVQPHSKVVLNEAVKADADFLCKCNIMDYSLLLGVDEERRQIACGLVDTIGSYTFAKTLEYKAKQNLQSGKETTVIPPNEYHARFVNAINNYFLPCPDKWTKLTNETQTIDHELALPSVL